LGFFSFSSPHIHLHDFVSFEHAHGFGAPFFSSGGIARVRNATRDHRVIVAPTPIQSARSYTDSDVPRSCAQYLLCLPIFQYLCAQWLFFLNDLSDICSLLNIFYRVRNLWWTRDGFFLSSCGSKVCSRSKQATTAIFGAIFFSLSQPARDETFIPACLSATRDRKCVHF
jgi:hypothetical protein